MEAARELCEFVVERVPVQQQQIGWLIGKSGSNFKDLHGDPNPHPHPHPYPHPNPKPKPKQDLQSKTRITRLNIDHATSEVALLRARVRTSEVALHRARVS